jgi:hypothetical protein
VLSELQRVEVTFEGEELASFTSERGTTYRLFRYYDEEPWLYDDDEPRYFVHWEAEDGTSWLEHAGGMGMTWAQVAPWWPRLVENLD